MLRVMWGVNGLGCCHWAASDAGCRYPPSQTCPCTMSDVIRRGCCYRTSQTSLQGQLENLGLDEQIQQIGVDQSGVRVLFVIPNS